MTERRSLILSGTYTRLIALFVSAGILLAANGLILTLISLKGRNIGFTDAMIGTLGSAYYGGFFLGCILTPILVIRVGHIRVFAAFAAISALSVFSLLYSNEFFIWLLLRIANGVALCGCAMTIESWLNALTQNENRARVFSVYRVVDLGAVTGGQFLLPIFGIAGFEIFVVTGMLFCLCLVPMCLSREGNPKPPEKTSLNLNLLWKISPVAAAGCLIVGLTNGAFRTVGPIYAQELNLDIDQVALFISLWIIAGAIFQFPLGYASDRVDRRYVLIIATLGAGFACLFLSGSTHAIYIFIGGFLFGGFALPLYSLSAAQAYDNAEPSQFVELAASLTLFFTLGATLGPFIASYIMDKLGPSWFFVYAGVLHITLIIFVFYRITKRKAKSSSERGKFVWLLKSTPILHRLAKREGSKEST